MKGHKEILLQPVILAVAEKFKQLQGKEKIEALSGEARKALARSARISDLPLGQLTKNGNGAPEPSEGTYWSLTHTDEYVAAVAAPFAVGIDIEEIKPVSSILEKRIATEKEWHLAPEVTRSLACRFWTAKEAVLKSAGHGLSGLDDCTITEIIDHHALTILYQEKIYNISHFLQIKNHIISITSKTSSVDWHLISTDDCR